VPSLEVAVGLFELGVVILWIVVDVKAGIRCKNNDLGRASATHLCVAAIVALVPLGNPAIRNALTLMPLS